MPTRPVEALYRRCDTAAAKGGSNLTQFDWQGEEDALPRDIHALKMQAMHTFGSNRIFAANDFFTYQASRQPCLGFGLTLSEAAGKHINRCCQKESSRHCQFTLYACRSAQLWCRKVLQKRKCPHKFPSVSSLRQSVCDKKCL